MRVGIAASLLMGVVLAGCAGSGSERRAATAAGPRVVEAARAVKAPVVDGKLDDACWGKAKPVTGFITYHSDRPGSLQSIARVCYDDANLYVGVKCLMPKGVKPVGRKKKHDTYVFSDDIVEVFLDPGRKQGKSYQLVVNAYGSTFDCLRQKGGGVDPAWNGDWDSAAEIGDGYWSMEMAIPFYTLGITPGVGSTWGINITREAYAPRSELSSIGARGQFGNVKAFAVLKGVNADFSNYFFRIGPAVARFVSDGKAVFTVPVTNESGKTKRVRIKRLFSGANGEEKVESKVAVLADGEAAFLSADELDMSPIMPGKTDLYEITSGVRTKKIVVSDADDGRPLAAALVRKPWTCEAMNVTAENPWRKDMDGDKTPEVRVRVNMRVDKRLREEGALTVSLVSRDTGKTVAVRVVTAPSESTEVVFPTDDLDWGAYDARAVLAGGTGQILVSSEALATILPGGKRRIKVLNNLVSELMNAKERDLLGEKKIAFMNPRKGWVFFSVAGPARVTLDDDATPLCRASEVHRPGEDMRLLSAGRHTLHVEGAPKQIIVRAIPDLFYSTVPGEFSWEFLKEKGVLSNCTSILGSTGNEAAMREWTGTGRKWYCFAIAPGHGLGGEKLYGAEEYYRKMLRHEGFSHPLTSGVLVDQIGAAPIGQKVAIAGMVARILANPALKGRIYGPWYEGTLFGSAGDRAFVKLLLDAGWPFSYYVYLVEQRTVEQVRADIRDTIVRIATSGDEEIPGSLRNAVVTLGFWSWPVTGQIQDIDPGANFKILMQMQFDAMANDPELFGLYGALWYYSPYVDEECLRWANRLFRHYGIEGKTTKPSDDPYRLKHIENPDFEDGLKGWAITEAEPGAVRAASLPGYGHLAGRYLGGTRGDTFLVMKHSAKGPSSFSQEIRNLTPGRTYSVKMISADYGNITQGKSVEKKDAVFIKLDNVTLVKLPGKNSQITFPNHYGHQSEKFKGKHNAYMNFHWYVFRAKGTTARLTVSDRNGSDIPAGEVGREVMCNYIQVEPYFEEAQ